MINRRGFLQMLGAMGASSLVPLEPLLALPEASEPISADLGEGVWWIPTGGKPMRLEVVRWDVGTEYELEHDYSHDWDAVKHSGRSQHFAEMEFYGPMLDFDQHCGTLRMRLKMFGPEQFQFSDCFLTDWRLSGDGDRPLTQTAIFRTGMVTRSLAG